MMRAYRRCFYVLKTTGIDDGTIYPCAWFSMVWGMQIYTVLSVLDMIFGTQHVLRVSPHAVALFLLIFAVHWLWLGRAEAAQLLEEEFDGNVSSQSRRRCQVYTFGAPVVCLGMLFLLVALA